MSDIRDCDCPKRDPYLCAAHTFKHCAEFAVDTDEEIYCCCDCHAEWWDEAQALVGEETR